MIPLFSNLPNARELHFRKRELLIRAQDSLDSAYFIKSGYVRNFAISSAGGEFTLAILKKGDIFPLEVFLKRDTSSYFFEALGSVTVYRASSKDLKKTFESDLETVVDFNTSVVARFYGVLERMQFLAFGDAYGRVASILAICAERFGETTPSGSVLIKAPLAHRDIASLVGLTRETVSIEMKKLELEGFIANAKRSRILIKDLNKLRSYVMKTI